MTLTSEGQFLPINITSASPLPLMLLYPPNIHIHTLLLLLCDDADLWARTSWGENRKSMVKIFQRGRRGDSTTPPTPENENMAGLSVIRHNRQPKQKEYVMKSRRPQINNTRKKKRGRNIYIYIYNTHAGYVPCVEKSINPRQNNFFFSSSSTSSPLRLFFQKLLDVLFFFLFLFVIITTRSFFCATQAVIFVWVSFAAPMTRPIIDHRLLSMCAVAIVNFLPSSLSRNKTKYNSFFFLSGTSAAALWASLRRARV